MNKIKKSSPADTNPMAHDEKSRIQKKIVEMFNNAF